MVIRSVTLYLLLFLIWKLTVYEMVEDRGTVEINIGVDVCANETNVECSTLIAGGNIVAAGGISQFGN